MPVISSLLSIYSNCKEMAISYSNVALIIVSIMTMIYYFYFTRIRKQYKKTVDIMKLVNEFHPESLCDNADEKDSVMVARRVERFSGKACPLVLDKVGVHIKLDQVGKCLNMASSNYLNVLSNEDIESKAINVIRKYGVGSCGPRGFYGTVDVHLNLESRIAEFMNMEESIVYSYGFSTIASTIPAYCKSFDVIFCDAKISDAAKSGLLASKSKCIYFQHNDAQDLENKIQAFIKNNKKVNPKQRRFLLLEGIYGSTGTICDLPNMVRLRSRYQMRLFLDESNSIGVLGKTGRGVLEHHGVDPREVDLIIGSLETAVGSIGGFCVGSHFIIEHQRLSGLGYCFSASLPPLLADAAILAFDHMDNNCPHLFEDLKVRSQQVHRALENVPHVRVSGDELSPIKYLEFSPEQPAARYEQFVRECCSRGLAVSLCPHGVSDDNKVNCSIKLHVNVALTQEDIKLMSDVLTAVSSTLLLH